MSPPEVDSTKDIEKKPSQRRINKPLIEKRRRARINESLAQLKTIVLEATDSKGPRPSKLEKADILEMTVEFIKRTSSTHRTEDMDTKEKEFRLDEETEYSAGYAKCLSEISKYLDETRTVNEVSKKLIDHISQRIKPSDKCQADIAQSVSRNGKVKIQPLQKYIPIAKLESPNEAVDLSMRNTRDGQKDPSIEQNQNMTNVDKKDPSIVGPVTNQQLPVGLVCGSQVMLLLQFPQSMTPSQDVTSLFPQLQTVSGSALPTFGQVPQVPVFINSATNVIPADLTGKSPSNLQTDPKHTIVIPNPSKCATDIDNAADNSNSADEDNTNKRPTEQNDVQNTNENPWRPW